MKSAAPQGCGATYFNERQESRVRSQDDKIINNKSSKEITVGRCDKKLQNISGYLLFVYLRETLKRKQ